MAMSDLDTKIRALLSGADSRFDFWCKLISEMKFTNCTELGVFRGDFAERILSNCLTIEKYYMIDPWRNLKTRNKPANKTNDEFERIYSEAMQRTDFASEKRIVLRGKTTEVINQLPDESLDFAYVDGDHTLKGITIDLISLYPKIKEGGWIGGDDFTKTIWQHSTNYEPTLIFPFAIYFAEAVNAPIYALPFDQFAIIKSKRESFSFIDLTASYPRPLLREQIHPNQTQKKQASHILNAWKTLVSKIKILPKVRTAIEDEKDSTA